MGEESGPTVTGSSAAYGSDPLQWAPPPGRVAPDGCVLVWEPEPVSSYSRWTTHPQGNGNKCRYTVGPGHAQCKRPAVAWLDRSQGHGQPRWYAYCGRHLFGRRIHNGQVWHCVALAVSNG